MPDPGTNVIYVWNTGQQNIKLQSQPTQNKKLAQLFKNACKL
jgi:hypothetical protein